MPPQQAQSGSQLDNSRIDAYTTSAPQPRSTKRPPREPDEPYNYDQNNLSLPAAPPPKSQRNPEYSHPANAASPDPQRPLE
jgi:hypothetical protein